MEVSVATPSAETFKTVMENEALSFVTKNIVDGPVGQDLSIVVAADVLTNSAMNVLQNLSNSIKAQGFIVLEETNKINIKTLKKELDDMNLIFVAKQKAGDKEYLLLKKNEEETENPELIKVEQKTFDWVNQLKESLQEKRKIILVNKNKECSGIVGLVTCLRVECPDVKIQYLFMEDDACKGKLDVSKTYAEQLKKQVVANVLKNGQWGSYQHLRLDHTKDTSSLPVEHAYINTITRGDLSSLKWIESPLRYYRPNKSENTELCNIYYAPLNFRYYYFSLYTYNE